MVVYLRAAVGLLPGYGGTLADIAHLSSDVYLQAKILGELPQSLLTVEFFREAATMLLCIALLAAAGVRGAGPCSCEPLPSGTSCTTSVSGRRSAGRRRSPRPTCSS